MGIPLFLNISTCNLYSIGMHASVLLYIGLGVMISKIKKAENKSKLTSFSDFDELISPVIIIDKKDLILYANKAANKFSIEYLKYTNKIEGSLLPDEFKKIISPHTSDKEELHLRSNLDQNTVFVSLYVSEMQRYPELRILEICHRSSILNIETTLQKRNDELQTSLNELSYIISHDLIEPVRTIKSFAKLVFKNHIEQLKNKEALSDFEFLMEGADRLYSMIKGMLDYSKLSSKIYQYEELDSLEVLVSVIKDLMAVTNESNASIQCHDMPIIRFNRTLLAQVFSNLINNSLKYKSKDRLPKIDIYVEEREGDYLFTVEDNGIGFNNEQAQRIFVIFQRLHSNNSDYAGTGMGLAICKRIIENEKGKIWAEGIEGKGAKFYFTIKK